MEWEVETTMEEMGGMSLEMGSRKRRVINGKSLELKFNQFQVIQQHSG